MGDKLWTEEHVRGIVTLGTPHFTDDGFDRSQGLIPNLNRLVPGAFFGAPFFYVTVASDRVVGNITTVNPRPEGLFIPRDSASQSVFNSYLEVCGDGAVAGDGVVPLKSAHLDGATQLTLKCFHSIQVPRTSMPTD